MDQSDNIADFNRELLTRNLFYHDEYIRIIPDLLSAYDDLFCSQKYLKYLLEATSLSIKLLGDNRRQADFLVEASRKMKVSGEHVEELGQTISIQKREMLFEFRKYLKLFSRNIILKNVSLIFDMNPPAIAHLAFATDLFHRVAFDLELYPMFFQVSSSFSCSYLDRFRSFPDLSEFLEMWIFALKSLL